VAVKRSIRLVHREIQTGIHRPPVPLGLIAAFYRAPRRSSTARAIVAGGELVDRVQQLVLGCGVKGRERAADLGHRQRIATARRVAGGPPPSTDIVGFEWGAGLFALGALIGALLFRRPGPVSQPATDANVQISSATPSEAPRLAAVTMRLSQPNNLH
jgi:hypothetical protein